MSKSKLQKPTRIYYMTWMDVLDVNKLPKDQQKPFIRWIAGQTLPLFTQFPNTFYAYYSDYELWYGSWSQGSGKVAKNWD